MWISQKRRGWVGGVAAAAAFFAASVTLSPVANAALRSQRRVFASFSAAAVFAPRDLTVPTISGTPSSGHALSASTGTWANSPSSYAFQWQRCNSAGSECAAIKAATASSYNLVEADASRILRVLVKASNAGGTTASLSAPTQVITLAPTDTALPWIAGTVQQGQQLTASSGEWSAFPAASYAYQWLRCTSGGLECAPIAGATAYLYTAQPADAGLTVRVTVTASNSTGTAAATSAATSAVTARPANTALPVITGTAQQAQTLAATGGSWSGFPTPTLTYAWQRCNALGAECATIAGATSTTRLLSAADVGRTIRAAVTASNSVGSATATSAATSVVAKGP